MAIGDLEFLAGQGDRRGRKAGGEVYQALFKFSAQDSLDAVSAENGLVEGGVETVGAKLSVGIENAEFGDHLQCQPCRGVHWEINCNQIRPLVGPGRERGAGQINCGYVVARIS